MPTREETHVQVGQIMEETLQRHGNTLAQAWLGIYRALLWYEPVSGIGKLPHIIDANYLRNPAGTWVTRAKRFGQYLAENLGCDADQVAGLVDQLLASPGFQGLQRQNPLGNGFIAAVQFVLKSFGDSRLTYKSEFPATDLFPAISLPGRSEAPKIDLAVFRESKLVAIISTKWSLRHDRIGDLVAECRAYKAAGIWTRPFRYCVVTNEFNPARLAKVVGDECFDVVVHIRKEAVTQICGLDGRLPNLYDLVDFIRASTTW